MAHPSARDLALAALRQWHAGKDFADAVLARLFAAIDLSAPDRAFATELFYGVLRNLFLLDFWIHQLRRDRLDHDTRHLLRLGLYQLFLLETPAHAAVYETVNLAPPRARSIVNAILRAAVRSKTELLAKAEIEPLCLRTSHPEFLIDRWTKTFNAKNTALLCEWNNRPAPIYARINRLRVSVADFRSAQSEAESLPVYPGFVSLKKIPNDALTAGDCYIQDPSTAAACLLLDPKPGEKILDACAAPGGKTGYLAELMENRGLIVACDRDGGRIATLQKNLNRLGVEIVQYAKHDWTSGQPPAAIVANSPFDRILLDAPCSNTGVMRRRVDLRWRLTPKDFARMHEEQLRILGATVPLMKPGGVLVYSTCSIESEENQNVVACVLQEYPFLKLSEAISLLPFRDGFDGAYAAKLIRAE